MKLTKRDGDDLESSLIIVGGIAEKAIETPTGITLSRIETAAITLASSTLYRILDANLDPTP